MPLSPTRYLGCALIFLLSACAGPQRQTVDWNNINYVSMACSPGSTLPGCKSEGEESLSSISKSGKSSSR